METTIASYQEKNIRMQLVYIMPDENKLEHYYCQIRKNRKVLTNIKDLSNAKIKFYQLIGKELLQTSINYETK